MPPRTPWIALCLLALLATGCVERALVVRSDPPGAQVFVDGRAIGTTPARLPFDHYGTREVMVRMERRESAGEEVPLAPVTRMVEIDAPWYQYFPLDFAAEFLWPWTIVDERVVEVALVPHTRAELIERFARSALEQGIHLPFDPSTPAGEDTGEGAGEGASPAPPGSP